MKKITITIDSYKEPPSVVKEFINNYYVYEYDETTAIRDLFNYLLKIENFHKVEESDEILERLFKFVIKGHSIRVQLNYRLNDFIEQNNLGENIVIWYAISISGGYGGDITTKIRLYLYGNEGAERNIPHAHVYKGNEHGIRINLNDLSIMKANHEKNNKNPFNKKEMKIIRKVIKECQEELITNFEVMQRGGNPEEIIVNLETESYIFRWV